MKHLFSILLTAILLTACSGGGTANTEQQAPATAEASVQPVPAASGSKRVLHVGDTFGTPSELLNLFGLNPKPQADFQPVPGLKGVVVWTPDFGSNEWHYVASSGMGTPTIQESWNPAPAQRQSYMTPEYIEMFNNEHYYEMLFRNFVRITFAKDYQGRQGYTYLGIYVMSRDASSVEHITYEQIQADCPLADLSPLVTLAPVATPIQ